MSSLSNALATDKAVTLDDGSTVQLPRLDLYDLARIDDGRKAQMKAVARSNGKEAGLTPADLYNICTDIDLRSLSVNEMLTYATTPKGATDVLEASLIKGGKSKEDARSVISRMANDDAVGVAIGLVFASRKRKDDTDPNAQTAAAGTPATAGSQPATTSTPSATSTPISPSAEPKGFGD